jgi:hypothetical protein
MFSDWSNVESGVRVAMMSNLKEGIPCHFFIGPYPVETRYRGQVPQCAVGVADMGIAWQRVSTM